MIEGQKPHSKKVLAKMAATQKERKHPWRQNYPDMKKVVNGECFKCQMKKRKGEIGPNKKAFRDWMRGNTVSLNECDTCGKQTGILPKSDMDRAIRASQDKYIHPLEWD